MNAEVATDSSNFTIHSRMEILHILRAIQQKNELATVYFNQGKDFILTSILAVDTNQDDLLILDYGADEARNKQILASDKITLVTTQEHVKVQFTMESIEKTEYLGRPAFKGSIPSKLMKLQRREYYRIFTPMVNALKCVITRPEGGRVETAISNISLGGIAITNFQNQIRLNIGDRFSDCHITLPDIGPINPGMEVRSEDEIILKSGAKTHRAGCMFIDLPTAQQTMIQRYIIRLERERLSKLAQ